MKKPTALGSYIFAGGFTVGVRKHFEVLAHFEEGPYGTETAAHNLPELRGNIHTDPATWPVEKYAGRIDFVYANPPCAPWSVCSAGRAVPWRLDPRVGCTQRAFGLLKSLRPKVWAFESVRPTFTKGRELIDEMVAEANGLGYHATALMVEGTRHGVPQRRPRFFLVLSQVHLSWSPTKLKKEPTVGEAFAKPFSTSTHAKTESKLFLELIKKTPRGRRVAAVFNELYPERVREGERKGERVTGRPSFQNLRLDPEKPSCTLTGGAKQVHPTEHRLITVEESAVLCGYPRNFKFLGSTGVRYKQVAQAVMPPVGEYLAKVVRHGLERNAKVRPGEARFDRVEIFTDRVEHAALQVGVTVGLPPAPPARAKEPVASQTGPVKKTLPGAPKKPGSGARIRELLRKGWDADRILETIRREFPESKAGKADVSWNRRKLQQEGASA